ncbi:MAG TPA: RsmE family RNA methyltransferase [Candidatus Paceibacterota bacterium]
MRLHRFYIDKKIEGKEVFVKEERLLNQWRKVFRYKTGDRVILFDGSGMEFIGELKDLKKEEVKIEILEEREGILPKKIGREIILCQSLIKKDKMEWVVEKATELGVSKIVPIISDRSEKKGFNIERARKIAVEASEQCGRADVPEIREVENLEASIKNYSSAVVFDSSGITKGDPWPEPSGQRSPLVIFIGPEGGWTSKEIERFKKEKMEIFSLGNLILRAETAAITALATLILRD